MRGITAEDGASYSAARIVARLGRAICRNACRALLAYASRCRMKTVSTLPPPSPLGGRKGNQVKLMASERELTTGGENAAVHHSKINRRMAEMGHERPKGDVRAESVRLPTADIDRRGP
jgi:hypothetical protein